MKPLEGMSVVPDKSFFRPELIVVDVPYSPLETKMRSMAKEVGYRANLCLAGGFYYRMGRWIGEPYIKNAVNKAESLCFPAELISILAEYYGEEQLPSSPESALVHMVDAVVIRLEAMEQNVGQSVWNRDIVIYQTVNDFSSSEIYDHSGMSMNQFLKIREFLAKEELLR